MLTWPDSITSTVFLGANLISGRDNSTGQITSKRPPFTVSRLSVRKLYREQRPLQSLLVEVNGDVKRGIFDGALELPGEAENI